MQLSKQSQKHMNPHPKATPDPLWVAIDKFLDPFCSSKSRGVIFLLPIPLTGIQRDSKGSTLDHI
jgi:hypothetical protein